MPSDVTIDRIFTELPDAEKQEILGLLLLAAAGKNAGTSTLKSKAPPLLAPETSNGFWNRIFGSSQPKKTRQTYTIAELLQLGASVDYCSTTGLTPLMRAASIGSTDNASALHNANVNYINRDGESALTIACDNNHRDVALYLIGQGADVNRSYSFDNLSFNPLSLAIKNRNTDLCRALIEHNADLNTLNVANTAYDVYEVNALGNALIHNAPNIATIIIEKIVADHSNIELDRVSSRIYSSGNSWFRTMLNNASDRGAVITISAAEAIQIATAQIVHSPISLAAAQPAPATDNVTTTIATPVVNNQTQTHH